MQQKAQLQNAQYYIIRPMLQNVQNKVRDSILFNFYEAAALSPEIV